MALAVGWIYWPALRGGWISDDKAGIALNRELLTAEGLGRIWRGTDSPDYFPLTGTVQWLEWHLFAQNTAGYHGVNVCLHLLSAVLFCRLLGKFGVGPAWIGGFIFAVHPLAVESVAWISELKNTLSLPLLILAFIFHIDGRRRWALAFFTFAMLAKTSAVMFPAVLVLYAWWRKGRVQWSDIRAIAPFAAVSIALALTTIWFQGHRAIAGVPLGLAGPIPRIALAGTAAAFYFCKCLWPAQTAFYYPKWPASPASLEHFLPLLVLAAFFAWLWAGRRRHAVFAFGSSLINVAPVAGLIPMAYLHFSWTADHLAYLAIPGVAGLAAAAAGTLPGRIGATTATTSAMVAGLLAFMAWTSHRWAGLFRDEKLLWSHTLSVNPRAWPAQANLGAVYLGEGRTDEAIGRYRAALRIKPDEEAVQLGLGAALLQAGKPQEASAQLRAAVAQDSRDANAHFNFGSALLALGRTSEAMDEFRATVRLNPAYPAGQYALGVILVRSGRLDEGIGHLREAVRLDPAFAQAHNDLGIALEESGQPAEALLQFSEARRLNPNSIPARQNLARALSQTGGASSPPPK